MSANLELARLLLESEETFTLAKRGEGPLHLIYTEDAVVDVKRFDAPGFEGTYRGLEEIRGFWMEWFGAWRSIRWNAEFHERGEVILADVFEFVATGEASGIEIEMPHAQTFRFRDGRITNQTLYLDRAAGFAAAGVAM